jgi:hypothetical protein
MGRITGDYRTAGETLGPEVLRRVGKKRHVTSAFQSDAQFPLMSGAGAGLPARLDLGALGEVASEAVDLLVVDQDGLVGAERADLATASVAVEVVALPRPGGGHGSMVSCRIVRSSVGLEGQLVDLGVVEAT